MPAQRSRTERWRDTLDQIRTRGGGLEFSIDHPGHPASDLVWRVRVLDLTPEAIIVETPAAAGQAVSITPGTALVVVIAVGQNRWMFRARVLAPSEVPGDRRLGVLRLSIPDQVERCSRREFLRTSLASVQLPGVTCWPLLDPASAVAAEAANRAAIERIAFNDAPSPDSPQALLPDVGPPFNARLMNVGGGGLGLLVHRADASAASRHRLLWVRVDLTPHIPAPLGLTARVVHDHLDSEQNLYLGAAFDFSHHPAHRQFVAQQILAYVGRLQHRQAA